MNPLFPSAKECRSKGIRFDHSLFRVLALAVFFLSVAASAVMACNCGEGEGSCCSGCGVPGQSCCCCGPENETPTGVGGGQPYREPVVLSAVDGKLEVELTLKQGSAHFDTAAAPASNALLFCYRLVQGNASDGKSQGTNLYPGPTLNVYPGQTLVVHLKNGLSDLTIRDYSNPSFTAAGKKVPLYPEPLVNSPFNLHTHGLHVSPAGNSDNVLLSIPSGMQNTYTYSIPDNHPQGLYWYHTHRHMLTAAQTYRGLVGMLAIGRVDGGIPAVTTNNLPVRSMAIQYNYVFNRKGGQTVLNNPFWPADLSTLNPQIPANQVANPPPWLAAKLADGTYEPSLAPINFLDSPVGTQFFTAWWVGKLSVDNNRGIFQYLPSNLQTFTGNDGTVVPVNPALPDDQRDLQYTVNGQFQPVISTPPGQTEIWVLGNFTDAGYVRVRIVNTATGNPIPLVMVGKDGNPVPNIQPTWEGDGTVFLLEPATRVAFAVTMPQVGGLRLEMPSYTATGGTLQTPIENVGILYTNAGGKYSAVVGNISVSPDHVSYMDGFFYYPTQTLLTAAPSPGTGTTVAFTIGQPLGAYTSFVDLAGVTPDVLREFSITGGFTNKYANPQDPNAFAYQLDNNQFPFIPVLQPRLNTSEQWTYRNQNNDQHPIHIHVNDYQLHKYVDPVANVTYENFQFGEDNQNCPAPLYNTAGDVLAPGLLSLRTEFQDYIGAYVYHCHRLNHEDNGLMALINVIPEVTAYAFVELGAANQGGSVIRPTQVVVINEATSQELARVTPFGVNSAGPVDVAMGDVNGDMILDLIVGGGAGMQPLVKAFDGASNFANVLFERTVFAPTFRGGVRVAAANIDGEQDGDNVIVASGPGMKATVVVLPSGVAEAPSAPFFAEWNPYGTFEGGVDVDAGIVADTGRNSIVTVPGPGIAPMVHVFGFSLFTPLEGHEDDHSGSSVVAGSEVHVTSTGANLPEMVASFRPFPRTFRGGLRVATGWVAGLEGGFSRIIVGQESGGNKVAVFTSGSMLNGHPQMYVTGEDIEGHSHSTEFYKAAEFATIQGAKGVDVATSANPTSADLIVVGNAAGKAKVAVYDLFRASRRANSLSHRLLNQKFPTTPVGAVGGR